MNDNVRTTDELMRDRVGPPDAECIRSPNGSHQWSGAGVVAHNIDTIIRPSVTIFAVCRWCCVVEGKQWDF